MNLYKKNFIVLEKSTERVSVVLVGFKTCGDRRGHVSEIDYKIHPHIHPHIFD